MLQSPTWREVLDIVLTWYFQAIQPQNFQIRVKPWPVVANAVGAALERLCVTILVREFNIRGLSKNSDRLEKLLELIGLTKSRGYDDIGYVQNFLSIRNDATHPRSSGTFSKAERDFIIQRAIQWIEETLLWRLGYSGKYRSRLGEHYTAIEPRYDLSSRDPNWSG